VSRLCVLEGFWIGTDESLIGTTGDESVGVLNIIMPQCLKRSTAFGL
jgi:hypothetical protein